jgi:hypothetical protein
MQSFDQIPPPSSDQDESPQVQPQSFTPEPPPSEGKKVIILVLVLAALIAGGGVFAYKTLFAKNRKPLLAPSVVSVGDPRDKVIRVLGKPKGSTVREHAEILIYDNGHVEIENGVVTVVAVGQGAQRGEIRQSNSKKNIILLDGGRIQTRSENKNGEK